MPSRKRLFGKQFTSTKAGEPSDESELQGRTQGSWSSVAGKTRTKVVVPFRTLKSPDIGAFTSYTNKKVPFIISGRRESFSTVRDVSSEPFGCSSHFLSSVICSSLPSPPFLQSGDRCADRWTQDIRTQEWGGWK